MIYPQSEDVGLLLGPNISARCRIH